MSSTMSETTQPVCPYCINGMQVQYVKDRIEAAWECPECGGTGVKREAA
jgi:predicted RNA-binding Zn-ribbon protein involved in translation (DUF1610 family)